MNFRNKKKNQAELSPLPHPKLNKLTSQMMTNVVFLQTISLVYLAPILIHPFLLILMVVVVMIILTLFLVEVATMTIVVDITIIQDTLPHRILIEVTHDHHSEIDSGLIPQTDVLEAVILTMGHLLTWIEEEVT